MTVPTTEPAGDPMFVYGSLMSPHVLYSIIGQPDSLTPSLLSAQMYPATLHAHKRHSVRYADFPAVVKTDAPTDSVSGFLVVGLTEAQKACVDRFEGSLYTREEVQVVLEDGQKRRAKVYVWAGDMEGLGAKEWSFEAFKRTGSYARWGYVEK